MIGKPPPLSYKPVSYNAKTNTSEPSTPTPRHKLRLSRIMGSNQSDNLSTADVHPLAHLRNPVGASRNASLISLVTKNASLLSAVTPSNVIAKGGNLLRRASSKMLRRPMSAFPSIRQDFYSPPQRDDESSDGEEETGSPLGRSMPPRNMRSLSCSPLVTGTTPTTPRFDMLSPMRSANTSISKPSVSSQRSLNTPSLGSASALGSGDSRTGSSFLKTPHDMHVPIKTTQSSIGLDIGLTEGFDTLGTDLNFHIARRLHSRSTFAPSESTAMPGNGMPSKSGRNIGMERVTPCLATHAPPGSPSPSSTRNIQ